MTLIIYEEYIRLSDLDLKNKLEDSIKKKTGMLGILNHFKCVPTRFNNNSQSRDVNMVESEQLNWSHLTFNN